MVILPKMPHPKGCNNLLPFFGCLAQVPDFSSFPGRPVLPCKGKGGAKLEVFWIAKALCILCIWNPAGEEDLSYSMLLLF